MDSSIFDEGASSDFEPQPVRLLSPTSDPPPLDLQSSQIKAKATVKKAAAATTSKATTAPKKLTQTTLKKPAVKKRPRPDSDEENSDPAPSDDDSFASTKASAAKKPKKAPAPKKPIGKPLEPLDDNDVNMDDAFHASAKPKPKKGSATEQYQKVYLH